MTTATTSGTPVGASLDRIEGRDKVTGRARYAYDYPAEHVAYAVPVQSTIASGTITRIGCHAAIAMPGVLAVLTHENAPRLSENVSLPGIGTITAEISILQAPAVSYRGQIVAAVVAETLEAATEAQRLVRVEYQQDEARVELRPSDPGLYRPTATQAYPYIPDDSELGDFDSAFAAAEVSLDETYTTAATHNNPMEPHASIAQWQDGQLVLHHSTQNPSWTRNVIAGVLGLPAERVRVISPHVGGGFGSKIIPQTEALLAALAAQVCDRPVKVAYTRQQMWSLISYRTPTIQHICRGASKEGRLTAIAHDVIQQTSMIEEFAEQTAVISRLMYAAANRRTTHRLARLNVPTPGWMRAPGSAPGSFALESAMDELAIRCGIDPVELRIRNEPEADPESGLPFSSRHLLACLREGAGRFGWSGRNPAPGIRRDGRWLIGTGVAAASYAALGSHRRRPPGPTRTAPSPSRSPPPTSEPAPAPCSPRSPRAPSASNRSACTPRSGTARCRPPRRPWARRAQRRGRRPWLTHAGNCGTSSASATARSRRAASRCQPTPPTRSARRSHCRGTRSAPNSLRCESPWTAGKSASRGCSLSSPPARS